jgi:hypothetical protein
MQYYLKMLLESMPFLMKQQQPRMGGGMPPHQQRGYQGGNRGPMRGNRQMGGNQMTGNRGSNMQHMQGQQMSNM